jgi:hypothetical protein
MEKHDFIAWENSEEAKQTFKEELVDALRTNKIQFELSTKFRTAVIAVVDSR